MGPFNSLHENIKLDLVYETTDPNATTDVTSAYVDMTNKTKVAFKLFRTGTSTDAMDVFKLVQATSSGGANVKDITGAAMSVFTSLASNGQNAILEVDVGSLDTENDFKFVAAVFSLGANAGTDLLTVVAMSDHNIAQRSLNTADPDNNAIKAP